MRRILPFLLLAAGCATSRPGPFVARGLLPARVHVAEDFETDIERRWWLAGRVEEEGGGRFCRGTTSKDFDDKMGDPARRYTAVIFNPVPGPPMGPRTRLAFRYRIRGSDTLRVQIYSLTRNYHRQMTLRDLPQDLWQEACVDLTLARRPDGSGGPLSADERIDDLQFYADPSAELWIDDILLFEAAGEGEHLHFPRRVLFTGWFDTGAQGKEWPGDFDIVPHEKPRTWKAARSKDGVLRVDLRGERRATGAKLRLRVETRRRGEGLVRVALGDQVEALGGLEPGGDGWKLYDLEFDVRGPLKDVRLSVPAGVELLVDNLLLYEP